MEEDYKKHTDLNAQMTDLAYEKQQEIYKRQEAETKITQLEEEVEKLKAHLKSNGDLLEMQREDVNKERLKTADKHLRIKELEETLVREQEALEKAK